MKKVKISQVKANDSNPRYIKDHKFTKLVDSIKEFPEMLEARPIVVNKDMVVLGGNMRLRACQEAGLKEVFIEQVNWSEKKQNEFIIKDNVSFGEWDWDVLANEWENQDLGEWGLDVWQPETDVDYSILEDQDELEESLTGMANNVKKAIQIEFEPDHYEEAYEIVKFWRDQDAYVGKMILDFLNSEKGKL